MDFNMATQKKAIEELFFLSFRVIHMIADHDLVFIVCFFFYT